MNQALVDYFRCPQRFANFRIDASKGSGQRGYFRLGPDIICYGTLHGTSCAQDPDGPLHDALDAVKVDDSACLLPFDPAEVAANLRYERYARVPQRTWKKLVRAGYYAARPMLPVAVRKHFQKAWLKGWDQKAFPKWPVDRTVDQVFELIMRLALRAHAVTSIPFIWFWPEGKSSCAVLTHDVETDSGLKFCGELMDISDSFAVKSSFQLIPEARYTVSQDVLESFRKRGFEVNVHDLRHDGHLYSDREKFAESAIRINQHARRFGSKGFRSGALYRNLEWYDAFEFSYDMSVPNVGHLDPQPGGCCTVMPYFVGNILEIPVTTIQDYSLFNILGNYSLDVWAQQVAAIVRSHGLCSFILHPDYLQTRDARNVYVQLLQHLVKMRSDESMWIPLPGEVDEWWRQRNEMTLLYQDGQWHIEGSGAERARVAYASIADDQLVFSWSQGTAAAV